MSTEAHYDSQLIKQKHLLCQISITFAWMNAMFMVMPDSWISTQVLIKRFTKYASVSLHAQRFGLPQSMAAPDAETDISSGVSSESDKDIVNRDFKLTCLLPSSNFPRVLACHGHAAINCVRSRCGNCLTAIDWVSLRILRVP